MNFNRLSKLFAVSALVLGVAGNANAVIYDFGTLVPGSGSTAAPSSSFATLEVTAGANNAYTFDLSFLSGFNANSFIISLAVDNSNGIDAPETVTNLSNPSGSANFSLLGRVDETSSFSGYDFDFEFSPLLDRLNRGDAIKWTSTFAQDPGTFDKFAINIITPRGFNIPTVNGLYQGVARSVTAVPEPETYAMFLAGLGLLGFASKRRKNA